MASLVGKTVRIEDKSLLLYFYPGYVLRESLSLQDYGRRLVYAGRPKRDLIQELRALTPEFINTTGACDADLSDAWEILLFAFARHEKRPSEWMKEVFTSLSPSEGREIIKLVWVTGAWPFPRPKGGLTVYSLFDSSVESQVKTLSVFFELLESYPAGLLESSFYTFMERAMSGEEQNVKAGYLRLLAQFRRQSGERVKGAVLESASLRGASPELRLLSVLLNIRGF